MSELKETIKVKCPRHYVMHHAERYFSVHRRDVAPGTIALKVDLSSLKLPGATQARHDVRVQHQLVGKGGEPDALSLSWDPEDKTVPRFAGMLESAQADAGNSILILEGAYEPPFALVGAAFDAVVGKRIASATLRSLLEDMREFIEKDFQTALATNLADSPKD
ncbi:MAG: hypothetical protein JO078_08580 [Candidatus Eremiobacteraeota bacterium]|nr:hypothetical protein [Candidatus Eremiobacteraeota bacterium]MBV9700165.1 hypothetical protein [Candidatus Eremiobacteraeota bacterium]